MCHSTVQSVNSRRGGSLLRQLSTQLTDCEADGGSAGLETVMWTRELAKRLLLPRADVEGLEDLLDTYFMLVSPLLPDTTCHDIHILWLMSMQYLSHNLGS